MSSPSLRIRSGAEGSFSVGQNVPVLGAVSYSSNGMAVQSATYRSRGVLFNVAPVIREGVIDLAIDQQLSNFVATTTAVNELSTLTRRALKTSVGMPDDDLIVLGSLTENKESGSQGRAYLLAALPSQQRPREQSPGNPSGAPDPAHLDCSGWDVRNAEEFPRRSLYAPFPVGNACADIQKFVLSVSERCQAYRVPGQFPG